MPSKTFTNRLARFISNCVRMAGIIFLIFLSPNIWAICDLDPTFGNGGLATTTIPNVTEIGGTLILDNGKILQAARLFNGNNLDFAVAQFNTDGSLDTTFGNGGIASVNFPANLDDYVARPAVQSDGKIILVGFVFDGTVFDIAMVRFDTNGNWDPTFGTGGFVQTDVGTTSGFIGDVAILSNDDIILSGTTGSIPDVNMAAAKYDSNGNLDTTFGNNGIVIVDVQGSGGLDVSNSMEIQPDQKILLAGTVDVQPSVEDFAMVRLNSDGTLDNSFGNGGIVVLNSVLSLDDFINQTIVQPDGKILAVGTHQEGPEDNRTAGIIALVRFNSDGSLDHTFGKGGFVRTDFPGFTFNTGWDVTIRQNGKILVAADVTTPTASDFLLVEYNPDGSSCDTSLRSVNFPGDRLDRPSGVSVQSDGKILIGGGSGDPGGTNDFAMARFDCSNLSISPTSLPIAQEGVSYNQSLSADGGTPPYTFSLKSGMLPTGILFDEPTATFSGTPAAATSGDYSLDVQAVDNTGLIEDQCYVLKNTMLNEVFDDGVLNPGWTFTGAWQEINGFLIGGSGSLKAAKKKSTALASPVFGGCTECRVRTLVSTAGGIGNKISVVGWYEDKKEQVELIFKEEKDVVVLKKKGSYPGKAKAKIEINPNQLYHVEIEYVFATGKFHLRINGFDVLTLNGVFVSGTFGYRVKQTVGTFGPLQID